MYDLSKHPYFKPWTDPVSGITSYILTERAAPVQFPFYFTNSSISPDGKYLWFYTAFPPTLQMTLGCVSLDPENPWCRHYPQAGFSGASPMIAPDSSGVYFTCKNHVYFMDLEGNTKIVVTIPADYIDNRVLFRNSTHLTMSCDHKYLLLDGKVGNVFYVALGDVATGEFKLLHEFSFVHNHAAFSPTDPNLFLLPRDWERDPYTGKYNYMEMRLWLMDVNQTIYRPLCPDLWESHNETDTAHEWWSADGNVCYVDYRRGVFKVNPHTCERTHIWKRPICHAQSDISCRYYCCDQTPYNWQNEPVKILFYDSVTEKETPIADAMPQPPIPMEFRRDYHFDPHPHFSPDGNFVIYMSTVNGNVDVAVTPVEQMK
ncbi:MAG: hypothetical protein J6S21_06310 [Victivallales bacterium]|nr:hypothetical protein [Victivallales bacterium]